MRRSSLRTAIPLLIALAYGLVAWAFVAAPLLADDADMSWNDEALITAGKTVFDQRNCNNEFCHGPRGGGNMMGIPPGTKLTDDTWFYSDGSYAGIMKIISEGIPSSPMEPWGTRLGDEKLRQVAAFVKSISVPK